MDSTNIGSSEHKPLTQQEAQKLRQTLHSWSPWAVVGVQFAVGVGTVLLIWLCTQATSLAWSAFYGVMVVWLPTALFVRGIMSPWARSGPTAVVTVFMVGELVKLALMLAMLVAANRVVKDLSWPALLAGLVVTLKAIWLVGIRQSRLSLKDRKVKT